jgi:hypothetical protein
VPEDVLDEEGHAPEGALAEARFVERVDTVGVGLHDGVHLRIRGLDGACGGLRHLARRYLAARDEGGDPQGVVGGVFLEIHAIASVVAHGIA